MRAKKDRYDYCKILIEAGAMVNTVDAFFQTPMVSLIQRNMRLDQADVKV